MHTDFLIVGGGAIGLSSALELARRGKRVRVIERHAPGGESSWAGAGILSTLLPWQYGGAVNALADYSLSLFPDWIARLRGMARTDPEYLASGMLVLPPLDQEEASAWLAARGHRDAPPPALRAAIPAAETGLWLPEVAQVRNPRAVAALVEALTEAGVEIHPEETIQGLEFSAGRVSGIRGSRARWQAEAYVIAAGAWSRELLGPQALGLTIRPIRGQMLLYRAAPGRLPCIVYQHGKYLVPRADGHILAGSSLEDVGFDKTTTREAEEALRAFVAGLLPDVAQAGPIRHWSGLRPGSAGNLPTIARHPHFDNLYLNSGHFRYGVTMAPGSARLLADLIDGIPPAIDPVPYAWPEAQSPDTLL